MSGAVGRHRPGILVGIRHLQIDGIGIVSQAKHPRSFQRIGVWPGYVCDAVESRDVGRHCRHDQKRPALQDRALREREINVAGDAIVADVFIIRVGVVQFDEFQVAAIGTRRRLVHDFRNHQAGLATAWTNRLGRQGVGAKRTEAHLPQIPKFSCGRPAGVVTGHGQAKVNSPGHGDVDGPQSPPV